MRRACRADQTIRFQLVVEPAQGVDRNPSGRRPIFALARLALLTRPVQLFTGWRRAARLPIQARLRTQRPRGALHRVGKPYVAIGIVAVAIEHDLDAIRPFAVTAKSRGKVISRVSSVSSVTVRVGPKSDTSRAASATPFRSEASVSTSSALAFCGVAGSANSSSRPPPSPVGPQARSRRTVFPAQPRQAGSGRRRTGAKGASTLYVFDWGTMRGGPARGRPFWFGVSEARLAGVAQP